MQTTVESTFKTSRKRKEPPPPLFLAGSLTRQKSQKYFFHHNRSGKSRKSRSFSLSSIPINPQMSAKLSQNQGDDGVYDVSIKDLRARRVFSKPPQEKNVGKSDNPGFDSELTGCKLVKSDGKLDGLVISRGKPGFSIDEKCGSNADLKEDGGSPNFCSELIDCPLIQSYGKLDGFVMSGGKPSFSIAEKCGSNVDLKENGGNPNFDSELIDCKLNDAVDALDGFGISREKPSFSISEKCNMSPNVNDKGLGGKKGEGGEGMDDEDVQTTPPEAVVLVRQNDYQNGEESERRLLSISPTKRISPSKDGSAEGKKSLSNPRKNMVLNLCSRRKVFKAPNSFSYRRLLPYLMDMAKEEPCESKVNQIVKTEMNVDDKPLVSPYQECVSGGPKLGENVVEEVVAVDEKEVSVEPKACNPIAEQVAAQLLIEKSTDKNQTYIVSSKSQHGSSKPNGSEKGNVSPGEQSSSDKLGKMDDVTPVVESNLAIMPHNLKTSLEPPEIDVALETPSDLAVCAGGESRAGDIVLQRETSPLSVLHSSTELKVVSSGLPVVLGRGILKRNPRGCRGICNCLNCTSFRLNAEKAFEFSRNQLLDGEEIASDLIRELSGLRGLLEKSATGATDVAAVPVSQVQEACRRASNVEVIARTRLRQMSEDLYVHCRTKPLQRPNVKFQ